MLSRNFWLDEVKTGTDDLAHVHSENIFHIARKARRLVYTLPEEGAITTIITHPRDDHDPYRGAFLFIDRTQDTYDGDSTERHLCILRDGRTIEFSRGGSVQKVVTLTYRLLYILLDPDRISYLEGWSRIDDQSGDADLRKQQSFNKIFIGMTSKPTDHGEIHRTIQMTKYRQEMHRQGL